MRPALVSGAVSDDKGIFVVPCVPRTGMRLFATADGFFAASQLAAQQAPLDLRLRRAGIVRGKVVDRTGAAVAGLLVHAITAETQPVFTGIRSAADGTFALTPPDARRFRIVGGERELPRRQFASSLLHGPADDVVVAEIVGDPAQSTAIDVEAVAADTGERLPRFFVSPVTDNDGDPSLLMRERYDTRREFERTARIEFTQPESQPKRVIVEAVGRAFAIADVPDPSAGPLRVELVAEAVLTGTVRDATTREPMAGVAVLAVPKGNTSISGTLVGANWPRTDADGRYRIGGLRAGDYQVQVHAPRRPSSQPVHFHIAAGAAKALDLTVPPENWIAVDFKGNVSQGRPCWCGFGPESITTGGAGSGIDCNLPDPAPQLLVAARVHRFGPVGNGGRRVELFMPSRLRVGVGVTVAFGPFTPGGDVQTATLPPLDPCVVKGRVELPADVATARVGVRAGRVDSQEAWLFGRFDVAELDADAAYALELLPGTYRLQLFDLETGIAFHSMEKDLKVAGAELRMDFKPEIHWLEVALAPASEGDEATLLSIDVYQGDGEVSRLLPWTQGGSAFTQVSVHRHDDVLRWLVPAVSLRIAGMQDFDELRRGVQRWSTTSTEAVTIDVTRPLQRVTLKVPAGPSDEDLEKVR